jgi:hypothetical protein
MLPEWSVMNDVHKDIPSVCADVDCRRVRLQHTVQDFTLLKKVPFDWARAEYPSFYYLETTAKTADQGPGARNLLEGILDHGRNSGK